MSSVDKIFYQYGVDFFGKKPMLALSGDQVEEARVFACKELHELTKEYGLQPKGTVKELFCNYIFEHFI